MVKFNSWPRPVIVGCVLLLVAGYAHLLQSDLARVSASAPMPVLQATPPCKVISGYVYNDANNTGLKELGEVGINGVTNPSTLQLRNSSNVVVATTTTDVNGFYQFSTVMPAPTPQMVTHTVNFPELSTGGGGARTMTVPQFDPALGTLTSVEITINASAEITVGVEHLLPTPAPMVGVTVTGSNTVSAPGVPNLVANIVGQAPGDSPFNAGPFDSLIDFGGASGKTFTPVTVSNSAMTVLAPAMFGPYTGTGTVTVTSSTSPLSATISGSNDALLQLRLKDKADFTVKYTYTPSPCLPPGNYTIHQTVQPVGFQDGFDTAGNVTPLPGSNLTDVIPVPLGSSDSMNNNFGERALADLAITKTDGKDTINPGDPLTYQIVVTNNGPNPVTDAAVMDTFPASLTGVSWTCAGMNGGTCSAPNGVGNINTAVSLPVGGKVTFTVSATVSASASGTISNTAMVTEPTTVVDTNQGNNKAPDTTDVVRPTDLAITKTDGLATAGVGSLLQYTIVVTNNGPTAVTNATVADTFPSNLANVSWVCTATAGSSCGAPNGVGNINATVNLLVNGKATFTVDALVVSDTPSVITNTATVTAPPDVTETKTDNNAATDITNVTGCPTAGAPTTVRGLLDNDLFLLPDDLRFTLTAQSPTAAGFFAVSDTTAGGNPGFPQVTSLGFSASAPNARAFILSCLDSFRELGFVLAAKGVTEGDTVSFSVQNPDGTGQVVLAAFVFQGGQFKVTQVNAAASLFANGNIAAPVGTFIPLGPGLGDSTRTFPIRLAVSPAGPLAACFQLLVEVARGGGAGATSVVLTNVNVNRDQQAGDGAGANAAQAGLLNGLTGGYPTRARCAAVCPTTCTLPPPDCPETVCFRTPDYYCARGIPLSVRSLRIPQINFGNPVPVRVGGSTSPVVLRYLGCGFYVYEATGSVGRMLTRYYLAAQISLAADPQRPDPCKLTLGCFLMMGGMPPPIPVTLSNQYTITANTNLQDFFKQTESAILEGRAADAELLLKIYKSLGCGD